MSVRILVTVLFVAVVSSTTPACAQNTETAEEAFHAGRYEEARALFRSILTGEPDSVNAAAAAADGYARTFEATGEYEAGLADRLLSAENPPALCARGRLLIAVGRYEEAEVVLTRALQQSDALYSCGTVLAELWATTGRARESRSLHGAIYERHQRGLLRTAPDLAAAGRSAAALEQFREANQAYRTAHDVDPRNVEVLYRWAELFRDKYNDADARRTYEDALSINPHHAPSLVGLAHATPSFQRKEELAQRALGVNPNSTAALDLLASLRILDGLYDEAEALARRALSVNPASGGSLAQLASVYFLSGDEAAYRGVEQQMLQIDPQAADFYLHIVENLTHRFRYPDAAAVAERAVEADPSNAKVLAAYGSALLRLGRRDESRRHLEVAYERDPFNLFAANMLTLLDTYDDFAMLESPHFRLLIHADEREVIGPLMLETAEAAYDSLSRRYPYRPSDKILIEAYNDPSDFAVRISGVPHQGLLGVSFGDVVAVNTPAAQSGESYNWARTLWHELAHTMAIGVSQHQVPRWFTEGLSLYEERRARAEWGREMEPAFLAALADDGLHPLEEIDRGFTRPAYPQQVMLSYFHASRVVAFVVDSFGFNAVVEVLRGLAGGDSVGEAVEAATGIGLAELDRRFRAQEQQRRAVVAQALGGLPSPASPDEGAAPSGGAGSGPFFQKLREGHEHLTRRDFDAAEAAFSEALSRYSEYAGPDNAYEGLAAVYRERGDAEALADVLARYVAVAENEVDAVLELAELREASGDLDGAAAMFERSLHVAPYDAGVRTHLADLHERRRHFDEAVLHRRAVVALEPPDRAGAYYRLARSLHVAGSTVDARRAVLQSLEIAPDFRDAQRLLLEIVQ